MMHLLTLKLKSIPRFRVDLSPITPDQLGKKNLQEICSIRLESGNQKICVGDLFNVSGSESNHIVIKDSCDKLDRIGQNMGTGAITVHGSVGSYTGFGMRDGRITIHGNSGDYTASGMKKGALEIRGNAGHFLASAIPGDKYGLMGGIVIINGDAGDRVGDRMRRGTVLIEGNAGAYCASRMLAGTIAVMGKTADFTGFAMKRGTLILRNAPDSMLATFSDCGNHDLLYLKFLFKSWRKLHSKFSEFPAQVRVQRLMGDRACDGKGEILICQDT